MHKIRKIKRIVLWIMKIGKKKKKKKKRNIEVSGDVLSGFWQFQLLRQLVGSMVLQDMSKFYGGIFRGFWQHL